MPQAFKSSGPSSPKTSGQRLAQRRPKAATLERPQPTLEHTPHGDAWRHSSGFRTSLRLTFARDERRGGSEHQHELVVRRAAADLRDFCGSLGDEDEEVRLEASTQEFAECILAVRWR